ncbi:hypothetical protein SAMN04487949_3135 [Halogranum gelatinilyticum]|uniref:Uncharacterized protein n=1 Tax=Halogranum gelatinilyticum TaxID=660521 RepID=A0A1G9XUN3_9EURY|nr:hypothetical protein [Halogranum gelatinilyticum]SDN00484.1 hypothetical protein SAMN04487949_3135 [Halogranum gelatinilyticum]
MALHSRRALLKMGTAATASAVALAGCVAPAYSVPVTVTNDTDAGLSTRVSLAEREFLDGDSDEWRLDLDAGETVERSLDGGGKPSDRFRLVVDPTGREQVRSTLRNPLSVAVVIDEDRIHVTVEKYSDEVETQASVSTVDRR